MFAHSKYVNNSDTRLPCPAGVFLTSCLKWSSCLIPYFALPNLLFSSLDVSFSGFVASVGEDRADSSYRPNIHCFFVRGTLVVVHWSLVLEVLDSIPATGEDKFRRTNMLSPAQEGSLLCRLKNPTFGNMKGYL